MSGKIFDVIRLPVAFVRTFIIYVMYEVGPFCVNGVSCVNRCVLNSTRDLLPRWMLFPASHINILLRTTTRDRRRDDPLPLEEHFRLRRPVTTPVPTEEPVETTVDMSTQTKYTGGSGATGGSYIPQLR